MELEENDNLMILDPSGIDISGTGKVIIDSSGHILTTGDICANDLSVNSIDIKGIAFPDPNQGINGNVLKIDNGTLIWGEDTGGAGGTTITGAATTIDTENLIASKALISNAAGKVATSNISTTELEYLTGVTSNIQTQITNAASSGGTNVRANYGNSAGAPLTKIEIAGVSHPISGGSGNSQWTDGTSNTIYYNSGNVGIGTDAPTNRLDVSGGLSVTNGAIITSGIRLSGNNLGTTSNSLKWDTNGNKIFYNTDNVGIGTNNPTEKLDVNGNIKANEIFIDTISEKTNATGVTIDSVLLKDQNITAHTITAQNYAVGGTNFISATRQGNFRDLEVKNASNVDTILLTGDGGHISIGGTLSADTISEKTNATGVTIDSVLLKDQNITAHTITAQNYAVGGTNFISATRQGNFRDLEVKNASNVETILLTGDGGEISCNNLFTNDLSCNVFSTNNIEIGGRNFPSGGNDGQVLKLSSGDLTWGEAAATFTGLTDTPNTFTANKYLAVNSGGSAIEFVDPPSGGGGGGGGSGDTLSKNNITAIKITDSGDILIPKSVGLDVNTLINAESLITKLDSMLTNISAVAGTSPSTVLPQSAEFKYKSDIKRNYIHLKWKKPIEHELGGGISKNTTVNITSFKINLTKYGIDGITRTDNPIVLSSPDKWFPSASDVTQWNSDIANNQAPDVEQIFEYEYQLYNAISPYDQQDWINNEKFKISIQAKGTNGQLYSESVDFSDIFINPPNPVTDLVAAFDNDQSITFNWTIPNKNGKTDPGNNTLLSLESLPIYRYMLDISKNSPDLDDISINLFGDGYTENLNKTTFTLSGTNITNDHNLQPNYVYKLRAYNTILQDYSKPSDISDVSFNLDPSFVSTITNLKCDFENGSDSTNNNLTNNDDFVRFYWTKPAFGDGNTGTTALTLKQYKVEYTKTTTNTDPFDVITYITPGDYGSNAEATTDEEFIYKYITSNHSVDNPFRYRVSAQNKFNRGNLDADGSFNNPTIMTQSYKVKKPANDIGFLVEFGTTNLNVKLTKPTISELGRTDDIILESQVIDIADYDITWEGYASSGDPNGDTRQPSDWTTGNDINSNIVNYTTNVPITRAESNAQYDFLINSLNILNSERGVDQAYTFNVEKPDNPTNPVWSWVDNGNKTQGTIRLNIDGNANRINFSGTNSSNANDVNVNKLNYILKDYPSGPASSNAITDQEFKSHTTTVSSTYNFDINNTNNHLKENQEYDIIMDCSNNYVTDVATLTIPKIQIKRPNKVTNLSVTNNNNNDIPKNAKNNVILTWTKPTEPGAFINGNPVANTTWPYINTYVIQLTPDITTTTGALPIIWSVNDNDDAPTNTTVRNNQNSAGNYNTTASTGAIVYPQTEYTIDISGDNKYFIGSLGPTLDTPITFTTSAPQKIQPLLTDAGYKTIFSGNFNSTTYYTNNSNVYNINKFSTKFSVNPLVSFNSSTKSSFNEVISGDKIRFTLNITGINSFTAETSTINFNGSAGTESDSGNIYTVTTSSLNDSYNIAANTNGDQINIGYWWQGNLKYNIDFTDTKFTNIIPLDGSPVTVIMKTEYLDSVNEDTETNSKRFDVLNDNVNPTHSGDMTITYTPYLVFGIATLRPNNSVTTIQTQGDFTNISKHGNHASAKIIDYSLFDSTIYSTLKEIDMNTGATTSTPAGTTYSQSAGKYTYDHTINNGDIQTGKSYSRDVKVKITGYNLNSSLIEYSSEKFIYDPDTYTFLTTIDNQSFPTSNQHTGLILNVPDDFDIFSDRTSTKFINGSGEWSDGLLVSSHYIAKTSSSKQLVLFKGKFHSPASLWSTSGFNTTLSSEYKEWTLTQTNYSTDTTGFIDNITNLGTPIKTFYKWQVFQLSNYPTGWTNAQWTGCKIGLSNTNITMSDLTNSAAPPSLNDVELWVKANIIINGANNETQWMRLSSGGANVNNTWLGQLAGGNGLLSSANTNQYTTAILGSGSTITSLIINMPNINPFYSSNSDHINYYIAIGIKNNISKYINNVTFIESTKL